MKTCTKNNSWEKTWPSKLIVKTSDLTSGIWVKATILSKGISSKHPKLRKLTKICIWKMLILRRKSFTQNTLKKVTLQICHKQRITYKCSTIKTPKSNRSGWGVKLIKKNLKNNKITSTNVSQIKPITPKSTSSSNSFNNRLSRLINSIDLGIRTH